MTLPEGHLNGTSSRALLNKLYSFRCVNRVANDTISCSEYIHPSVSHHPATKTFSLEHWIGSHHDRSISTNAEPQTFPWAYLRDVMYLFDQNPRVAPPLKPRSLMIRVAKAMGHSSLQLHCQKNPPRVFHLPFISSQPNPGTTTVLPVHKKGEKFLRACWNSMSKRNMSINGTESREEVTGTPLVYNGVKKGGGSNSRI